MSNHATLQYGDLHYSNCDYCVVQNGEVVLESNSKSTCIEEVQRRNGYNVIDGSESTYGEQLAQEGRR